MKKLVIGVCCFSLLAFLGACKQKESQPEKDKKDVSITLDFQQMMMAQEPEILKENPKFKPTIYAMAYQYNFENYDLVVESRVLPPKEEKDFWSDTVKPNPLANLPIRRISEKIYQKNPNPSSRPVIYFAGMGKKSFCKRDSNNPNSRFCTSDKAGIFIYTIKGAEPIKYAVDSSGNISRVKPAETKDDDESYEDIGQIGMSGEAIGFGMTSQEYAGFILYKTDGVEPLEGMTPEAGAEAIRQQMSDKSETWLFILDGISELDGVKAYEFTIATDLSSFSHRFDIYSRAAIDLNHNVYFYETVPVEIGKIPEDIKYEKKKKSHTTITMNGLINTYEFEGFKLETPDPMFRIDGTIDPGLGATGIYLALKNEDIYTFPIQKMKVADQEVNCLGYFKTNMPQKLDPSIELIGVDKIQDMEALEYRVTIEEKAHFSNSTPDGKIDFAVTQDRRIWAYHMQPKSTNKKVETLVAPMLLDDFIAQMEKEKSEHPENFIVFPEDVRIFDGLRKNYYMDEDYPGIPPRQPEATESFQYVDYLKDEFKGELLPTEWAIVMTGYGEIENEKTYEFDFGQGKKRLYLRHFKAALSETGKVYVYEDGTPKLVKTVTFK